jgi:hypothetical protein
MFVAHRARTWYVFLTPVIDASVEEARTPQDFQGA